MLQFIKFGIVGISNTVIFYTIYILSLKIFEQLGIFIKYDYFIASIIAFILSVLWSFYWNNRFTFKEESGQKRLQGHALVKTYISYSITGVFLNNFLLYAWVNLFGISKDIAPLISLMITIPLNFILNKMWAFR